MLAAYCALKDSGLSTLSGCVAELTHVELVVEALLGEQGVVVALFNETAVVDDEHLVSLADGAQAVGDDEGGAPGHEAQERFLNVEFGARIDAARGFVQDQDARVGEEGAGDGQQLALALAEIVSLFGDLGLVALRQAADEPVGIGQFGRCSNLFIRGIETAVTDIVDYAAGKEEGVLQHDSQLLADRFLLHRPNVAAVNQNGAGINIVKAAQEADDRRFARSGRADEGNGFSWCGAEGDIGQDRFARLHS